MNIVKINERITLINGDMRDCFNCVPEESVDLLLTDPPYGMEYVSNHRTDKFEQIIGDEGIDPQWFWMCRTVKKSGAMFCFHKWTKQDEFKKYIDQYKNIRIRNQVIWIKNNDTGGDLRRAFGEKHENIWYACGNDFFFPNGRPTTDLYFDKVSGSNLLHPNQKPIKLLRNLMHRTLDINNQDALVFDPFMGSGSTGVVAVERGYRFIGIELDEKYFNIAYNRIKNIVNQPRLF